jgi:GNAT superfamily N-acetyltransferase
MIVIRRGDRLDVPFLRSLLPHAWSPRVSALDTDVPISCYVDNWGRRGDAALIAMEDGHSVGAAWYRLFSESAHGYGFIDDETPELTVVVVPSRQGEGIGSELVGALVERAHEEGYAALSAAIERDHTERQLLLDQGFELAGENGATLTLRRALG